MDFHDFMIFISRDWETGWVEGKMDGINFRTTLKESLFQSARDLRMRSRFTVQKDTSVKHTVKVTMLQIPVFGNCCLPMVSLQTERNWQEYISSAVIAAKSGYTKFCLINLCVKIKNNFGCSNVRHIV